MEHVYLQVRSAEGTDKVLIGDAPVTVGRAVENVVVLTDLKSSRFHCSIERSPKGFLIRDLDSRNGTLVNGQPIKAAFLSEGDIVLIGATELELITLKVPAKAPAPLTPQLPPPTHVGPTHIPGKAPIAFADADDDIIDLGEADLEMAPQVPDSYLAEPKSDDAPLTLGVASGKADDERFLPVLAESLPDKPFDVGDIGLINARGHVVHPAIGPDAAKKRKEDVAEAVMVLRYVLLICARARASDVHMEPKQEDFLLRLRIDGHLLDIVRLTRPMGTRLGALVKILCDIDVQYRDIIQEGHFIAQLPDRRIDYRVSFAPSVFGQKMVLRVLDTANTPLHMNQLQLPLWMLEELQRDVTQDSGMIVVCGPTGSGKTTTLYSLLRDAGTESRNVVTIEDPVEIELAGVTQVPVNDDKGNTFSALLRSMLRQDPDVIMVGEIRDQETARIAMQAAMTGHLVLTTLHARDTIGAVFRLLDLGVEPYLVANSLTAVLTQRLARILCPFCKKAVRATPQQLQHFGKRAQTVKDVFVHQGCPKCLKTGFAGRRAFFEMLVAIPEVREVIQKNPNPKDIEVALSATRFTRLRDTGYQLVATGVSAFDEIERTVGR